MRYVMIRSCKHCKADFDIDQKPKGWMANHTRWCKENPLRNQYLSVIDKMNKSRKNSGYENQFKKAKILNLPIPVGPMTRKPGTFTGKTHTSETKKIMKDKALKSSHRRLRRKLINYNGVLLDSSWEVELAKRLDYLGIRWTRPDPIRWTDGAGIEHNYFPDFYLPDYDLYLDPKNPQAVKSQQEKLKYLLTQHKNVVILQTLDECKIYSP